MARATIKGLPQLRAKLIALKERAAPVVMPEMAKAAQMIVDMMKRLVPVDQGDLRDSIGWTFGDKPKYAQAITTVRSGAARVTIFAGNTKVRYAHLVEFGTKGHPQGGQFDGTHHPGTAAQPFFFPSYRALRREAKRMITKAINDEVKRIAGK